MDIYEELEKEVKRSGVLFTEENLRELLKDNTIEELESMIKDLCKAYSVDDDLMRIEAIEVIQKIIKEKN